MNRIYPYTSAQILTDDIFISYGGQTGTTTPLQRNAAYFIAEKSMANNLSAFAPITTITGSYSYPFVNSNNPGSELWLDWKYVQIINKVTFIDLLEYAYYSVDSTANIHIGLRNAKYGILDVFAIAQSCNCVPLYGGIFQKPYQVEVVYQAGLPTGTYTSPSYLLALTTVADIILNEFGGCGNESSPFTGITKFSNQQYSETRMGMYITALGASPRALFAYNLVKDLQVLRYVGL